MGAMERTLAFVFHKKGGKALSRMEMEFMLSMDLRWFTMAQAKHVVEKAVKGGYILEKEGKFLPAFSWEALEIPSLFKPDFLELDMVEDLAAGLKGTIEEENPAVPARSLFNRLLEHIMEESGKEKKDIIIRMNELKEMDVIPEMRLMVAASELGVDVSGFIDESYRRIKECS